MSQLKKALQQLSNEQEFYAKDFVPKTLLPLFNTIDGHSQTVLHNLLQSNSYDEARLSQLLKKHPAFVKVILHPEVMKLIRPWYQQHHSADFNRQRRYHTAWVDTLHVLCARYKKQLRHLILKASNGAIGISLSEDPFAEETLPTHTKIASSLLTTAQTLALRRALKSYQAILKLEKTLIGESTAQQKLYAFMHAFYEPELQAALHQQAPKRMVQLFKKLGSLFQFEQWLATKPSISSSSLLLDQNLISELLPQVKKIVL